MSCWRINRVLFVSLPKNIFKYRMSIICKHFLLPLRSLSSIVFYLLQLLKGGTFFRLTSTILSFMGISMKKCTWLYLLVLTNRDNLQAIHDLKVTINYKCRLKDLELLRYILRIEVGRSKNRTPSYPKENMPLRHCKNPTTLVPNQVTCQWSRT